MRIKLKAFPAIFLDASCSKHNCLLDIKLEPSKPYSSESTVGVQVTSISCRVGGSGGSATCTSDWIIGVSAPGSIEIVP